jgi:hypothetical protein
MKAEVVVLDDSHRTARASRRDVKPSVGQLQDAQDLILKDITTQAADSKQSNSLIVSYLTA